MSRRLVVSVVLWALTMALAAWFFRYERLAPIYYDGHVVVCYADRWTQDVRCKTVAVNAMTPEEFVGK